MNALSRKATGWTVGLSLAATVGLGAVAPSVAGAAETSSVSQSGPCRPIVVPGGEVVGQMCGKRMPPKLQACLFSLGGSALVAAATGGALSPAVYGALVGCGAMGVEWIAQLEADN